MQKSIRQKNYWLIVAGWLFLTAMVVTVPGCRKNPRALRDFNQVNILANNDEYSAIRVDPAFLNGWGLSFSPGGTAWVSAANTGLSEVLNATTGAQGLPSVSIPTSGDATMGGHPSGQLFNGTGGFKLSNGNPARFIFAGLDGVITGWNGGPSAVVAVDDSKSGAVYTGITLAKNGWDNFLYVANFSARKIDVYDSLWAEVEMPFKDPFLPSGYSPFNLRAIGDWIYVAYAKVGANGDEDKGVGNGFVDIFKTDGSFVRRFASKGTLNAPWGLEKAPAGFFSNDMDMPNVPDAILVGNFGDGRINVYQPNGSFIGQLRSKGKVLEIDGLWAISFAPVTATTVDPGWLFFAAGPDEEADGLFGYITK
ncbi:MAG: TIGR03118 family protein [Ginsengibacter sp.]